jgi:LuxR family maltose regulon positive regulatory protein
MFHVNRESKVSPDLLATKLNHPLTRKNLVARLRLIQFLNEAWQSDKKLSLVSAPAGYGKTTLVIEWVEGLQTRSSWLSLDKADNDPTRFLFYIIAALQKIDEHIGKKTGAMLQTGQPLPPEIVLTSLINEITSISEPFILILDDYHVIEAMPIHKQLEFLVDHQPAQMHLVIISREDPPLPLARLRARGQMIEIRQNDLRFSLNECADFLNRAMGLSLSIVDIAALEHRTEGWIAGLQLAALSMRGRNDLTGFIQAFTGSSHYVLDYLIEEVFTQQAADVQDFLLKTSILGRLSGPLCDAVVDRTNSRDLLERLEHANLFIIPLDQSCSWYRYHQLFADLLRQRLDATESYSQIQLHRRASQWFHNEGLIPEAIQHALAASDWETAAGLIQDNVVQLLAGSELMTLLAWLKALPNEVIFTRPQLCQNYGWALTLTGNLDAADIYLQHAENIARDDESLLGPILVARAYHLRVRGDIPRAIEYARHALSILPQADALSRGLAALTLGLAYWNKGDFQESEQAFLEVDQAAQQSGNHYAQMTALTYLGNIQAVFGHLHKAADLCHQVIQSGGQSPSVAPAHIELATLFYEWNQLDSAVEEAQIGIEQSQHTGNPLILCDGYRILAIIHQSRGEPGEALSILKKADQMVDNHQVSPLACLRIASSHVQVALAQGNLTTAQFWAEQVTEPTDISLFDPCFGLTPVRILLARQEKTQAADRLNELYDTACQKGCGAGMVEVRILQALAAETPADALHFLQDALKKAQPEGYIRTFVDKGEPIKALLERLKSQGGEQKEYILMLLSAFGETGRDTAPQPLVERLSERELDVLRLLEKGMSNGEIAQRLVVTIGTVKSHVHSIIDKLGVSSRAQAVAQARLLKLI